MRKFLKVWGIFIGFLVGVFLGLLFNYLKAFPTYLPFVDFTSENLLFPLGNVFLQALFMIIVPLIFSSLVVGIADMKNPSSVGTLSKRLFLFYAFSTFLAIMVGQLFMGAFKPGKGFSKQEVQAVSEGMQDKMSSLKQKSSLVGDSIWPGIVTKIVPRNIIDQFGKDNILSLIFVSFLFGFALLYMRDGPQKQSYLHLMQALSSICITIISWIMMLAPFAVAALITIAVSGLGLHLVGKMAFYMLIMLAGMLFHLFVNYALILKFLVKVPVLSFFARMKPVFITAFGTSSSSATMPVTMKTLEDRFGVPRRIVSFSIPIGVTVNMDGTALFEVAAALFIAQVFGVDLQALDLVLLVLLVFITSVGIAGVPGGSIPVLMSAIVILGLPAEGIALILGVDRLMDMGRTVVNVTGDSVASLFLSKKEGIDIKSYMKNNPV